MRRQELQAEYDRLRYQISTIKENSGKVPGELISLSCQMVCISICGSLEQCLKEIFVEFAKRRSSNQIYRPIAKVCQYYQNPKTSKIAELVKLFDSDFGKALEKSWSSESSESSKYNVEKSHLDNLIADRVAFAHGGKKHVNVTARKLDDYFRAYSPNPDIEILLRCQLV